MYTCVPGRTYLIFGSMSDFIQYAGTRNLPMLFSSENWLLKLIQQSPVIATTLIVEIAL